jgi:hypothetical protein
MAGSREKVVSDSDRCAAIVVAWRFECLVRAGYCDEDAAALATDLEADLHLALELVDRGCPPAVAKKIVS